MKVVVETLHIALCTLSLVFSNRNGKADKTFLLTVALNSLKAVIRISIFSEVPWPVKAVLLGRSH